MLNRHALVLILCVLSLTAASFERSGASALAEALRLLTHEARTSLDARQLVHRRADFASRFDGTPSPVLVARKLERPVNRDAFVDAYVRWQLTSFDPELSLDDRAFTSMVERLPAPPANPRADRRFVELANRASQAEQLSEKDRRTLQQHVEALEQRTDQARDLLRPARELRSWIAGRQSASASRQLMIELEWCAARIKAGWDVERTKATIESLAEQVGRSDSADRGMIRAIGTAMEHLSEKTTVFVENITIDDDDVSAQFGNAGVYDFEVRRWVRLLQSGR